VSLLSSVANDFLKPILIRSSALRFTQIVGLPSEVEVGIDEGLKHDSCIHCDELVSVEKFKLTNFIGSLSKQKIRELNQALKIALEIED